MSLNGSIFEELITEPAAEYKKLKKRDKLAVDVTSQFTRDFETKDEFIKIPCDSIGSIYQ